MSDAERLGDLAAQIKSLGFSGAAQAVQRFRDKVNASERHDAAPSDSRSTSPSGDRHDSTDYAALDETFLQETRRRAKQGDADAAKLLAILEAAQRGDSTAEFYLGHAFETGQFGTTVDERRALQWYGRAAAKGHADALRAIEEEKKTGTRLAGEMTTEKPDSWPPWPPSPGTDIDGFAKRALDVVFFPAGLEEFKSAADDLLEHQFPDHVRSPLRDYNANVAASRERQGHLAEEVLFSLRTGLPECFIKLQMAVTVVHELEAKFKLKTEQIVVREVIRRHPALASSSFGAELPNEGWDDPAMRDLAKMYDIAREFLPDIQKVKSLSHDDRVEFLDAWDAR